MNPILVDSTPSHYMLLLAQHDISVGWLPHAIFGLCALNLLFTIFHKPVCAQLESQPAPLPTTTKPALFSKTRIFLTISEKDEPIHASRGECYMLDIDGLIPFQAGQSLSLKTPDKSFFLKISSILWLTEHNCIGVYTDILECKTNEFANLCYTVETLGFKPIRLHAEDAKV